MRAESAALPLLLLQACLPHTFDDLENRDGFTSDGAAARATPDAAASDAGDASTDGGRAPLDGGRAEDASQDRVAPPARDAAADDGSAPMPPADAGQDAGEPDAGDAGGCGDTTSDPNNCGECGQVCGAPADGYGVCRMGSCWSVLFVRGAPEPGTNHGGTGSVRFTNQLCPANEVLIGVDGLYVPYVAFGLAVRCGRLQLESGPAGPVVQIVPGYSAERIANGLAEMPTPTPFELRCGPGEVVNAVDITSWYYWDYPTIKDFAVHCSTLTVDAQRNLRLTPATSAFTEVDLSGNQLESFYDSCAEGSVVVGFSGYAGSHIDGLETRCATLSVQATTAIDVAPTAE